MRNFVAFVLAALLLCAGCASIPLSTALSLSSLSPRYLAQIDPKQVRVKLSVPAGYELNIPAARLTLSFSGPSGARSAAMELVPLQVGPGTRPGGVFSPDIPVSTYMLALSPRGARELAELQGFVLSSNPKNFTFSVNAPFAKVPARARDVTFWADVRLQQTEPFMRLIDGAKIRFEQAQAGS
jgi:hypothetical protein